MAFNRNLFVQLSVVLLMGEGFMGQLKGTDTPLHQNCSPAVTHWISRSRFEHGKGGKISYFFASLIDLVLKAMAAEFDKIEAE